MSNTLAKMCKTIGTVLESLQVEGLQICALFCLELFSQVTSGDVMNKCPPTQITVGFNHVLELSDSLRYKLL